MIKAEDANKRIAHLKQTLEISHKKIATIGLQLDDAKLEHKGFRRALTIARQELKRVKARDSKPVNSENGHGKYIAAVELRRHGKTYKDIGAALGVTPGTVKDYLRRGLELDLYRGDSNES